MDLSKVGKAIYQSIREQSKAEAKSRFPVGRAMGRIEYFERQRGLPKTTMDFGGVVCAAADQPKVLKRRPRRATTPQNDVYHSAHQARMSLLPSFQLSATHPTWQSIGPNTIPEGQTYGTGGNDSPSVSGRCVGIMIGANDPDHLVVCAANGGLWESTEHGRCWRPLGDQLPTLSMGAIASAPSAPQVVYAGTGEGDTFSQTGMGLLRSSDGGLTWVLVPSSELSGFGIYDIAVDPVDPLVVWAGTTNRLLQSSDGGETWRVVQRLQTWDISINPSNRNEILAATRAGLIVSNNGGISWALVSLSGFSNNTRYRRMEVCHAPSRNSVVYVSAVANDIARLWRRATVTGPFTAQKIPPLQIGSDIAQSWYDWCMAVAPDDHNELYLGAVHLYKGQRVGSTFTWENISSRSSGDSIHPDQHHVTFDPSDPDSVYVCNDGGLYHSANRGVNWTSLNPGLGITEFEFITHLESEDRWILGGTQDNGTLSYENSRRWDQVALGDGGDCGVDDTNQLCYHSYYGMWIERAPALGSQAFSWTDVSPPFGQNYDALFYPPMEVNGSLLAKAGESVFVSEDQGSSWTELSFGGFGDLASTLAIPNATTIYLGTEGGLLVKIERGATSWVNATVTQLTSPRAAYLSDMTLSNNGDLWITSSAFQGSHVFQSQDGGLTFADRSANLPDIPVNALAIDPDHPDRIFIATDHGVYRTDDGGIAWTDFSNGLPNVVVGDVIFHTRTRQLRVGTRSRGIWQLQLDS